MCKGKSPKHRKDSNESLPKHNIVWQFEISIEIQKCEGLHRCFLSNQNAINMDPKYDVAQ
jgi:hypothetical protein